MTQPRLIRDIVTVPPHPTVVRLDHLAAEGAGWISEAFCVTGDVAAHLASLREVLAAPEGRGLFVIGPYGSGKSHFLAYVTQRIRAGDLSPSPLDVVALSLLDYRADEALEDIVSPALGIPPAKGDRRLAWASIGERYPRGLLLVIDELSEFLRSKPDRRRFNEDVRFLQYLGERAQGSRFWVLAAMQEQIEHTGDLESGLYRKIRDRFPVRYLLTPAHVRDLVRESLLAKKEGYAEAVEGLVREVRRYLPDAEIDEAALAQIYPVHPATLELLEEVRDRFSQARGAVDFTVTRLLGDPARGVAPFLDEPFGSLLTPDAIVDHFRDLFEIQPEFLPLAQRLLPYYDAQLSALFPAPALRELAGRVLKLLVLAYLSPRRQGLTAREAASWLVHRATRIEPQKNVQIVARVLTDLWQKGRFVSVDGERFRVDLERDDAEQLDEAVRREVADLAGLGAAVFELCLPLLPQEGLNPFTLPRDAWQPRLVKWHFHDRPYAVWLGDEAPPGTDALALWLLLPWGETSGAAPGTTSPAGLFTFRPEGLLPGAETLELAALARLSKRPWSPPTHAKLQGRIRERAALLASQVRNAYLSGVLHNPEGGVEPVPRREPPATLTAFLDGLAVRMLLRVYPAFDRHAPTSGPLPTEAFRAFIAFALRHDLGDDDGADDWVRLVREGYLVPMGLLQHKGRGYVVPKLDRHELVRTVLALLPARPHPRQVFEQLSQPIFGLVPDQVSLLLVTLLVLGEIDLLKGKKSFRDCYEMLPNPIQYDAIVAAAALPLAELRELGVLLQGFAQPVPPQWTVAAQRRAVRRLRDVARERTARLRGLLSRLSGVGGGDELAGRAKDQLATWEVLEEEDDELVAVSLFLHRAGSASRFLSAVAELSDLPDRLERLVAETERFRHLLGQPAPARLDDPSLSIRLEALGEPPALGRPEELAEWLERAQAAYRTYKDEYRARHDAYWSAVADDPAFSFQPPAVAASRHLGLGPEVAELGARRRAAEAARCRGLANLDYQTVCTCGFDGEKAPIAEELERLAVLRERIEAALRLFFAQDQVREQLASWVREGLEKNSETLAYIKGRTPLPLVSDVALFDRHLAGVVVVKDVEAEDVLSLLLERTWERDALASALVQLLDRQGAQRLRFRHAAAAETSEIARWCAEQALRRGVPLPGGLSSREMKELAQLLRPEWVSPEALRKLTDLGLPAPAVDRITSWALDGTLALPPTDDLPPLLLAVREVVAPSLPDSAGALATLAELLYRNARDLVRLDRPRALARLAGLATPVLAEEPPSLVAVLAEHGQDQWLVVDSLGLPFLGLVIRSLGELFPSFTLASSQSALVPAPTTTDGFYRVLAEAGLNHPLEKIDALDALLHERPLPFEDLLKLAFAELQVACGAVAHRLDTTRPLLVFGDHGFRLVPDGKGYQHGGPSVLERLVPVLRLVPRR